MEVYLLLGVHFLYDFHWQGQFVSEYKSKMLAILGVHSFTYAFLLGLVLMYYNQFQWEWIVYLAVTHFIVDETKILYLKIPDRTEKGMKISLYLDQVAHILVILGLVWYL